MRSAEQIQAALMAADLYVAKGDTEKAAQLLDSVKGGGSIAGENVVQLNNIGLKLGDKMIEEKRFAEALAAYQSVRRKSEVKRLQEERIAKIQDAINKGQGNKEELEAKLSADKAMPRRARQTHGLRCFALLSAGPLLLRDAAPVGVDPRI